MPSGRKCGERTGCRVLFQVSWPLCSLSPLPSYIPGFYSFFLQSLSNPCLSSVSTAWPNSHPNSPPRLYFSCGCDDTNTCVPITICQSSSHFLALAIPVRPFSSLCQSAFTVELLCSKTSCISSLDITGKAALSLGS